MPQRYELRYRLTRADWLAANGIGGPPAGDDASGRAKPGHDSRKGAVRAALWASPVVIAICTIGIGSQGFGNEFYLIGAIVGVSAAVLLVLALWRVKPAAPDRPIFLRQLLVADLTPYCGEMQLTADPAGVRIVAPDWESRMSWRMLKAHDGPHGFVSLWSDNLCMVIVPRSVFEPADSAIDFVKDATEWREAATLPHAQRLAAYLADRDLACPYCQYNLRGAPSERCPECGEALDLDRLTTSP